MDEKFRQEIERARKMTPEERVREGFALFEQGSSCITKSIRDTFPNMSDEEVNRNLRIVIRRCKQWGIT